MSDTSRPVLFTDARLVQMRLWSGLVLFVYVTAHLINHAMGLISREVLGEAGEGFKAFWRFPPIAIVLYTALAAHFVSALVRLIRRRSLKMSARDWMQNVLGFLIPFLLVTHVMGTRYASQRYGINDSYDYVLLSVFYFSPVNGVINALGLVAAWGHGVIGVYNWLSLRPWYPHYHSWLVAFAVLLPAASLAGYLNAGREILPLALDGEFMGQYYASLNLTDDAIWGLIARDTGIVRWALVAILVAALLYKLARRAVQARKRTVVIDYVDGPQIQQEAGPTLLEISKIAGVPHASVCGGRGRCSTCRVRVLRAGSHSTPPQEAEKRVLRRVRAPDDVRLACQWRPQGEVEVMRLLPSDTSMVSASNLHPWSTGREAVITVMFADLRDFTGTSEARLPFDVVYLINQFSQAMGEAVERHGGHIDKFLGDGFMALFGVDGDPKGSARKALDAADDMLKALADLNARLKGDLDRPLRMGVGLHSGPAVIGDMGYGSARRLTAIGDTVNTASRLEAATKDHTCALCVSARTVRLAGLGGGTEFAKSVSVRGKKDLVDIFAVETLDDLMSAPAQPNLEKESV